MSDANLPLLHNVAQHVKSPISHVTSRSPLVLLLRPSFLNRWNRNEVRVKLSATMREEERSAKSGVRARMSAASFMDLILSRVHQSRGPASAAAQASDQHNNLPYSIPQPCNSQPSTMTPPALSMDRPVTPDGPRAVNGGLYSGVQTPKTPVASTLSLTEYSANPTPPKESTKEKAQSLVPDAFLLPNGYPDVSSRAFLCCFCYIHSISLLVTLLTDMQE